VLALILATLTPVVLGLILMATEVLDRRSPEVVGRIAPLPLDDTVAPAVDVERASVATGPPAA
jgi:hypothetical protein